MSKKYNFVYGSALSTNTLAMMPVLQAARLSQMTSGQSDKILKQGDPYVFLNSTPSSVYDATLVRYVVGAKKLTRIAMLDEQRCVREERARRFRRRSSSSGSSIPSPIRS